MDLIYNRIKLICKERQMTLRQLSMNLGITEVGFQKMFNSESLKVKTLSKISEILDINITMFFENITKLNELNSIEIKNNHGVIGGIQHNGSKDESVELQLCKQKIKSLEEHILLLKDTIEILKNK